MKPLSKHIFVTGIDTNVGKTVASAILVEALKADYWKPVQAGYDDGTDTESVDSLITNTKSISHPEAYRLKAATVPAYAADQEGVIISAESIVAPETDNTLIIEGAGGLMVHLSKDFLIIDLIEKLKAPVILISENYLGSINHTLLSIEALQKRGIEILGIIYNGERSTHMRELIQHTSGIKELGSIDKGESIDKNFVKEQADKLREALSKNFTI
jgi:dethiobiotin synthetase